MSVASPLHFYFLAYKSNNLTLYKLDTVPDQLGPRVPDQLKPTVPDQLGPRVPDKLGPRGERHIYKY